MLYFIPSWYQENSWDEDEQLWYRRRMKTEFDDTVKQIQLFQRSSSYPNQIILLSHAPNFRHFLHRQGVYHAPYWSAFDAIQEIESKKIRMFSFRDLMWPKNTEFIYTPFVIMANVNGQRYATVEFGEDGNTVQINMYADNELVRCNYYDDRGFVSNTIIYEHEKPVHQDFLNSQGIWKLRLFYEDGHVEINPESNTYLIAEGDYKKQETYLKLNYSNLEEVILEVFSNYIASLTKPEDIFCLAMHSWHNRVAEEVLKDRKLLLSFFENRYNWNRIDEDRELIASASYIITDSRNTTERFKNSYRDNIDNIMDITPYDTRKDYGISQQLSVQKILIPVDDMSDETFLELTKQLAEYAESNPKAMFHYFTRHNEFDRMSNIRNKIQDILESEGFDINLAVEDSQVSENDIDDKAACRFYIEQCVDELATSKCLREQRIIVDMRRNANLYIQISALSMGIPQIVRRESQYVEHEKNGYILTDLSRLGEVLDHYLLTLKHWNDAMIYAFSIGEEYTTDRLLDQWREVVRTVGKD